MYTDSLTYFAMTAALGMLAVAAAACGEPPPPATPAPVATVAAPAPVSGVPDSPQPVIGIAAPIPIATVVRPPPGPLALGEPLVLGGNAVVLVLAEETSKGEPITLKGEVKGFYQTATDISADIEALPRLMRALKYDGEARTVTWVLPPTAQAVTFEAGGRWYSLVSTVAAVGKDSLIAALEGGLLDQLPAS